MAARCSTEVDSEISLNPLPVRYVYVILYTEYFNVIFKDINKHRKHFKDKKVILLLLMYFKRLYLMVRVISGESLKKFYMLSTLDAQPENVFQVWRILSLQTATSLEAPRATHNMSHTRNTRKNVVMCHIKLPKNLLSCPGKKTPGQNEILSRR